ncbi:MAG TPA: lamin tail domain-containing protein [Microbacteriaceae bacterium]|nr:lamin tail domain-containing protein [Microbacteriaceae bacterium]
MNWRTSDPQEEWIEIANGSLFSQPLTGLEITDFTGTQTNVHIYRFPPTQAGTPLQLGMLQSALVFTGSGDGRWHTDEHGKTWLLLFMGRAAPIWNNAGDVVYLRKLDGTIVDSHTVGDPPRHPNGH